MEKNRHAREKFLRRRYARERWFVRCAVICIAAVALFLGGFLGGVVGEGWRGFLSSSVLLDIKFDSAAVGERGEKSALAYQKLIKQSLRAQFPQATARRDKRLLYQIASIGGGEILKKMAADNPELLGQSAEVWLPAGGDADLFFKGSASADDLAKRGLPPTHIARLQSLAESGRSRTGFNFRFFTAADSRNPELAGIGGALRGSLFTLMLTFLFSFPLAIFAAVYLEMFAPRNRWFDFLEININNLAAVPSVIFGLLGLAVFINIFNLPRSSSLGGRAGAVADDFADNDYRGAGGVKIRAAVLAGGGAEFGRDKNAGGVSSCASGGDAGDADRGDYRHGAGAGRDRAAADDWDGGVYRRGAGRNCRGGDGAAGADFSLGGQSRARLCRKNRLGNCRAAVFFGYHERRRGLASAAAGN